MPATLRDVAERAQVSMRTVSNVVSGYEHVSERMRGQGARGHRRARLPPQPRRPHAAHRPHRRARPGRARDRRALLQRARPRRHRRRRRVRLPGDDRPDRARSRARARPAHRRRSHDALRRHPVQPARDAGGTARDERPHRRCRSCCSASTSSTDDTTTSRSTTCAPLTMPRSTCSRSAAPASRRSAPSRTRPTRLLSSAPRATRQRCASAGLRPLATRGGRSLPQAPTATLRRGSCSRSPRPDAIFCYSDLLAMGALRAVFDAGLRVPEDVAIIGIDDIEEGRYSRPSLSTVSLDTPFIARAAVARIAARIDDPDVARARRSSRRMPCSCGRARSGRDRVSPRRRARGGSRAGTAHTRPACARTDGQT